MVMYLYITLGQPEMGRFVVTVNLESEASSPGKIRCRKDIRIFACCRRVLGAEAGLYRFRLGRCMTR